DVETPEAEPAPSSRMLGLALQGQGQLDRAFEMFRKLPPDGAVMDLLYNLALDYERKGQSDKAQSVFRYIADHNPAFRDLESRLGRVQPVSEAVPAAVPGSTGSEPAATGAQATGPQKP